MAIISEGATLTFASANLGEIISINFSSSRGTIETSNLATTGGKTFLAAQLYEGEITVECYTDVAGTGHSDIEAYLNGSSPTQGSGGALVFTLGIASGDSAGATYTCTAIPTAMETGVGLESATTTSYTFKLTSTITVAGGS